MDECGRQYRTRICLLHLNCDVLGTVWLIAIVTARRQRGYPNYDEGLRDLPVIGRAIGNRLNNPVRAKPEGG